VVITPDGKKLAISNRFTQGITLWDLANHEIVNPSLDKRGRMPLTFLQLSPDGKVLATGGFDGLVRFWDMATGDELLHPLQAHSESVISAAFSPDGQVLATASLDQTIKLWELATLRELDTLKGHDSGVLNRHIFCRWQAAGQWRRGPNGEALEYGKKAREAGPLRPAGWARDLVAG
jgi:WD40 repeat protein